MRLPYAPIVAVVVSLQGPFWRERKTEKAGAVIKTLRRPLDIPPLPLYTPDLVAVTFSFGGLMRRQVLGLVQRSVKELR